jgi:hypothetical protein
MISKINKENIKNITRWCRVPHCTHHMHVMLQIVVKCLAHLASCHGNPRRLAYSWNQSAMRSTTHILVLYLPLWLSMAQTHFGWVSAMAFSKCWDTLVQNQDSLIFGVGFNRWFLYVWLIFDTTVIRPTMFLDEQYLCYIVQWQIYYFIL